MFQVMKKNHGVKIGSPDRGRIWAMGALVQIRIPAIIIQKFALRPCKKSL